jgi:hypothetical protein
MKVIVMCEESAVVREEFRKRGHDAWSCDLRPSRIPGQHYQGDARDILHERWDLMIAHPPCTRLCNSGVRWLHERNLWSDLDEACEFFRLLLNAEHIPLRGLENPIPHRYALERIGSGYDQIIQPWQFGHGETKATCLWLRGLPKLVETNRVEGREQRIWKMPPGPERAIERSKTYQGIAAAMAEQWGGLQEAGK